MLNNNNHLCKKITKALTFTFLQAGNKNLTMAVAMAIYNKNPKLQAYIKRQTTLIMTLIKEDKNARKKVSNS